MAEKKEYLFGIDLGTTYSCISYMDGGRAVVCSSSEGQNTTPSVVRMSSDEPEPIAGKTAKDTAILYPKHTFQFVKARIGRESEIVYGEDGELTTTPEEVSAEILKKLARDAGAMTNSTVKKVVITVPAYFGQNEREATRQAGIIAGLDVVDIVEEPTAAAFYYGVQNSGVEENICVFDLGGGTFDVTAMKISPEELRVITTEGDHDLGGRRWDAELIELAKEKFIEVTGYTEEFDEDTLQELQIKCEEAKIQLSSAASVSFVLKIDRKNMAKIEITREEFEDRTSYLLDSAIELTRKVIDRVKSDGIAISKILLVGGSTFMPQVRAKVEEQFGLQIEINEPNEAVSKGACIYNDWKMYNIVDNNANKEETDDSSELTLPGSSTSYSVNRTEDGGFELIDSDGNTLTIEPSASSKMKIIKVATKSFGLRMLVNGEPKIKNVIKKDTVLPVDVTITPKTVADDQRDVALVLYQSEFYEDFYDVDEDLKVAESILEGLPAGLPAYTTISLRITLNDSGLLEITGSYNDMDLQGKLEKSLDKEIREQ